MFVKMMCGNDKYLENAKLKFKGRVQSGDVHLEGLKIYILFKAMAMHEFYKGVSKNREQ